MLRNVDHVWKYMYLASCLSFISHEHGARISTLASACGLQGLQSYAESPTVSAVDTIPQVLHTLQAMESWAGPGNKATSTRGLPGLAELEQQLVEWNSEQSTSQLHTQTHTTLTSTWPGRMYVYSTHDTRCRYSMYC